MATGKLQFRLVDAFTSEPYNGNSAGVVLNAEELDERQMQQIAREINSSETAFLCGTGLGRQPRIRWFSPTTEVGFCGHATLAAAQAWVDVVGVEPVLSRPGRCLTFDSAAGELALRPELIPDREDRPLWWLSIPDAALTSDNTNPIKTCELLGMNVDSLDPSIPVMRTRDNDLILIIRSWQQLNELRPRFDELTQWSLRHRIRGYCVATTQTLNPSISVASRFFAPAAGIQEDPVTGSVHGPLATLLVINGRVPMVGGKASLHCVQGIPGGRTGLVRALVERGGQGYRVYIGGHCCSVLVGEMIVPQRR